MKKIFLTLIPLILVGCNVGNAPAGGSEAETKAVFDSMKLEDKVKFYLDSPMPMEDKKKKIEEAYAKEGKTMPADLFSNPGASGKPPVSTGPSR